MCVVCEQHVVSCICAGCSLLLIGAVVCTDALIAFAETLREVSHCQSSWLQSLHTVCGVDLSDLLYTSDGRSGNTASVHKDVQDRMMSALAACENAHSNGLQVLSDGVPVSDHPRVAMEATLEALRIDKHGALGTTEREVAEAAIESATCRHVVILRKRKERACIRYGSHTFEVRP